ncbi:hypothetical protein NFHSH190041_23240 [Shewanella sp. NFH-SH190041]|uniref:hypothetical protein n=1 Tax=Shewanella sp. NFH-SH190041 TaxID=2950245 RepID=UPI0021C33F22|nr:hypothetical protein [Shewanella sp. NFH-SH190041]BDM64872.1 hypothetical protein NFHSH190041_23240 [Shewanella sp. NFH-SH190041]
MEKRLLTDGMTERNQTVEDYAISQCQVLLHRETINSPELSSMFHPERYNKPLSAPYLLAIEIAKEIVSRAC